jgi:hypothetical protein
MMLSFCSCQQGFDHGVGHPLLLLCHAKAPNYGKKKAFKDLAYYSEWPKVADAVIKAVSSMVLIGVKCKSKTRPTKYCASSGIHTSPRDISGAGVVLCS